MQKLTPEAIRIINNYASMAQYKRTPIFEKFIWCPQKTCALFSGNQFGKTCMVIFSWVLRFLSMHPVASKNFNYLLCDRKKHHRYSLLNRKPKQVCGYKGCEGTLQFYVSPFRKMRFASENLPFQSATTGPANKGGASIEVRNTQYPELIKWLPPYLIKKNISSHNTVMVIKDVWNAGDLISEFVSYNQDVQAMAGVQLAGCAFDEEPPPAFFEEMQVRMLATDGTIDLGLTPANRMTYLFDQIYEQAQVYYRSETICNVLGLPAEERTDSKKSIAVFQAATDDNPTLDPKTIERIMTDLDTDGDPDKLLIRRYGVFKAVSTTIFRKFSYATHYLDAEKWLPNGVPDNWLHARSIDYHPVVPWAMIHVSLSDTNEAFVWWEGNPDPMRLVTDEIAMNLAKASKDYRFRIDRIDPLANQKQPKRTRDEAKTTSVTEDLNDQLRKLKVRGIGTGGAFIGFDTKSTRGREQAKLRLKNSAECGEPFNNKRQDERGEVYYLPTLWILNTCPLVAKSMKNWRLEDHSDSGALVTKDAKETPQQKWSHFPMAIEGILKEDAFRPIVVWERPDDRNKSSYFSHGRGDREVRVRMPIV